VKNNHAPARDSLNLFQMLQAEWQALPQRLLKFLSIPCAVAAMSVSQIMVYKRIIELK